MAEKVGLKDKRGARTVVGGEVVKTVDEQGRERLVTEVFEELLEDGGEEDLELPGLIWKMWKGEDMLGWFWMKK